MSDAVYSQRRKTGADNKTILSLASKDQLRHSRTMDNSGLLAITQHAASSNLRRASVASGQASFKPPHAPGCDQDQDQVFEHQKAVDF